MLNKSIACTHAFEFRGKIPIPKCGENQERLLALDQKKKRNGKFFFFHSTPLCDDNDNACIKRSRACLPLCRRIMQPWRFFFFSLKWVCAKIRVSPKMNDSQPRAKSSKSYGRHLHPQRTVACTSKVKGSDGGGGGRIEVGCAMVRLRVHRYKAIGSRTPPRHATAWCPPAPPPPGVRSSCLIASSLITDTRKF